MSIGNKILLFITLSFFVAFSLIPNTIAGLLAGYIFGIEGFAGMVLSYILASGMGYWLGRRIDSGLKHTIFQLWPEAEASVQNLKVQSIPVVIAFRLLPAPPFSVGNLILAWFHMPFFTFMAGSFLGMLPRMILVVWVGNSASDIWVLIQNPMKSSAIQYFSWFAVGLVLLGGAVWIKRKSHTWER